MSFNDLNRLLCIYHGNCDDGFAAAYVVREALGENNVEFYPGVYQQEPPDVKDRDVLLLDFSYKRPVMEGIASSARSVLVIDHHKTAEADLLDFGLGSKPDRNYQQWVDLLSSAEDAGYGNLAATDSGCVASMFDMKRSGAGLAWDFFNKPGMRPDFINYIEDRDLWKKSLPHGDEFTIALRSYPQDFHTWDKLMPLMHGTASILIGEGHGIQRYYRLRVEEIKSQAYPAFFPDMVKQAGPFPPVGMFANSPYFASSEVAGELCDENYPFGACFRQNKAGGWDYSLRSRVDFDVSEIAKLFGGGGHPGAAGFSATHMVHSRTE